MWLITHEYFLTLGETQTDVANTTNKIAFKYYVSECGMEIVTVDRQEELF